MSSDKKSRKNLNDENEKVIKRRCSLTGYSEKTAADFVKKISEHPCKGDWRRWRKIRIPYKQCLITWSLLIDKEPHHIRYGLKKVSSILIANICIS